MKISHTRTDKHNNYILKAVSAVNLIYSLVPYVGIAPPVQAILGHNNYNFISIQIINVAMMLELSCLNKIELYFIEI